MPSTPLSPAVLINEVNKVTTIPAVSTTAGAFVGNFQWGPVDKIVTIDKEATLFDTFLGPDSNTYPAFLSAASFLAYGNNLQTARSVGTSAKNAVTSGSAILIKNETVWQNTYFGGGAATGEWAARYPGAPGNALFVSICPNANAYSQNLTSGAGFTANVTASNTMVTFSGNVSAFVTAGDIITVGGNSGKIVQSWGTFGLTAIVNSAYSATTTGNVVSRSWQFSNYVPGAPGTSAYASSVAGANDQMHVIVFDQLGIFSSQGVGANTVLETYSYASKATDGRNVDGTSAYIRDLIFNRSKYLYWMNNYSIGQNWGNTAVGRTFTEASSLNQYVTLSGGNTDSATDSTKQSTWDLYRDKEAVDVSLLITGDASTTLGAYVINNIANERKDCVAFVSPQINDVVNQTSQDTIVTNIAATAASIPTGTYGFFTNNWKLMLDKYNNVYRWIPDNADIAGLCVNTDTIADTWVSPAGFNRGVLRNVVQLAWSPRQTYRDQVSKIGVQNVYLQKGVGPVLFGDSMYTLQPSAFAQLGIRRLFIYLEKVIGNASKYSLFEFNDDITRSAFVNLVTPLLRDVKGRRGVSDFLVQCDSNNNTDAILLQKGFIGDIYIKPNYSINWIQLNFTAIGPSASFTTTVLAA